MDKNTDTQHTTVVIHRSLVKPLVAFASNDYFRPSMCGVNFKVDSDGVVATATDGHAIVWLRLQKPEQFDNQHGSGVHASFTVPSRALTSGVLPVGTRAKKTHLLNAAAFNLTIRHVKDHTDHGTVTIESHDVHGLQTVTSCEALEPYPNTKKLLDGMIINMAHEKAHNVERQPFTSQFQHHLYSRFVNMVNRLGTNYRPELRQGPTDKSPIMVTSASPNMFGVLMPRFPDECSRPEKLWPESAETHGIPAWVMK